MLSGTEWLVDAYGCDADTLRDGSRLRAVCEQLIAERDLHVVGEPQWHQFPWPAGWTGLYLLSESHLACHTFPEADLASFSLFCCRPRADWPWDERLRDLLGATSVRVRREARGLAEAFATARRVDS